MKKSEEFKEIPNEGEDDEEIEGQDFNFITEMFIMTHTVTSMIFCDGQLVSILKEYDNIYRNISSNVRTNVAVAS